MSNGEERGHWCATCQSLQKDFAQAVVSGKFLRLPVCRACWNSLPIGTRTSLSLSLTLVADIREMCRHVTLAIRSAHMELEEDAKD